MRTEDQNLAPDQYADLNRQFYDADFTPADYLGQRLRALLLATCDSELIRKAQEDPFDVDGLKLAVGQFETTKPGLAYNFLTVESGMVLHHAAETLTRLYLAHRGQPACPWLEAARQRHPAFRLGPEVRRLRASLGDSATADALMEVFMGAANRAPGYGEELTQEMWDNEKASLVELFGEATHVLVSEAPLYNAAKHGLAIVSGDAAASIDFVEDPEPEYRIVGTGRAVTYLDRSGAKGEERWNHCVKWVSAENNLRLIVLIIQQIENLWQFARARYLRQTPKHGEQFRLHLMARDEVREATAWQREAGVIRMGAVSHSLEYLPDD